MCKLFLLLTITFAINSCKNKEQKKIYNRLAKQITPSGKYIIYDYLRSAGAFGSDISGREVFAIEEEFIEGKGQKINGHVAEWLNNDTVLVYNLNAYSGQPVDTLPTKIEFSKIGDFTVKTLSYKTNHGGGNDYSFDSVWTTENEIAIKFYSNSKKRNTRIFPLGSVRITTSSDTIKSIEILERISKSMNFRYLNKDGIEFISLPSIGTTWYTYKPTKTILKTHLSKKKIFWVE